MSDKKTAPAGFRTILIRWLPFGILAMIVLGGVSALLLARWRAPERVVVDLSESSAATEVVPAPRPSGDLRVAVGSMLTPSTNYEAYRATVDYLGDHLDLEATMVQRPTYREVNDLIAAGDVDLAFVCSGAYMELRQKKAAELFVVPVVDGTTTYHSLILTHPESDAVSLADLRGTTFAFTDPLSNSGFYYPTWRVHELGSTPDTFFGATTFSNSHEASIELVATGAVDAAAVDSLVFDSLVQDREDLRERVRLVEKSEPFGIPPVVIRTDLAPEYKRVLRELLLNMEQEPAGRDALAQMGFERFVEGQEPHYDTVQQMINDIESGTP
jgi:phosphonate transport system substrate-binding protein